jgi:Fe-S oxidoreductase
MLPLSQKWLFLAFALFAVAIGCRGFYRLYKRIAAGRSDTDNRFNHPHKRLWRALVATLTQSRTFRKRPAVSLFHAFVFYGFAFYLLVNLVDAMEGFVPISLKPFGLVGETYVLLADILSALVLIGVVALIFRRFLLPSRRDFSFNPRTMLHREVRRGYITLDSIIVSAFILIHVGSRAVGAGANLALEGPDRFAPFATLLSHLFSPQNAIVWRIFGYWGALGSVLVFLTYFPYSKHVHIFLAPVNYFVARDAQSGVLPAIELNVEEEEPEFGANKLEDLAWPRLLDAYACVQCNRCQDVCPAAATGKALSPAAIEINKRMELNHLARRQQSFEGGSASPNPLLTFALPPEAAWACTTCGACIEVCPARVEPMLDIVDIRRRQVMIESDFPAQLQAAFRGMERANNPWGISQEKRMDWAVGLNVKTTDDNPEPDVLFWVGCAASYDPQSQKTARAFVQLLNHAGVDYAVLGKQERCTGDSARRAGNEYLYRQLAEQNIATLNAIKPKLIVATCPHCMNAIGKEYRQIGGNFQVMHHTECLESLVADGRLIAGPTDSTVAYHDPCYLGRHNGVFEPPRNILKILSNSVVELPRSRENSFCCGAGGAQFWKEEEPGTERVSDNRYREAQQSLAGADTKVLAVGCPFCKSMLQSTPGRGEDQIAVRDIAELLLDSIRRNSAKTSEPFPAVALPLQPEEVIPADAAMTGLSPAVVATIHSQHSDSSIKDGPTSQDEPRARKKWTPKVEQTPPVRPVPAKPAEIEMPTSTAPISPQLAARTRKAWTPKSKQETGRDS